VKAHLAPLLALADGKVETLFLEEFEPFAYKDFIPRKAMTAVRNEGESLAEYVWRTCKEYKYIWGQRIKVDHYLKHGGLRPQSDFLEYI
jgi:hypothetical protein